MLRLKYVASLALDDPCMAPPCHVKIIAKQHKNYEDVEILKC